MLSDGGIRRQKRIFGGINCCYCSHLAVKSILSLPISLFFSSQFMFYALIISKLAVKAWIWRYCFLGFAVRPDIQLVTLLAVLFRRPLHLYKQLSTTIHQLQWHAVIWQLDNSSVQSFWRKIHLTLSFQCSIRVRLKTIRTLVQVIFRQYWPRSVKKSSKMPHTTTRYLLVTHLEWLRKNSSCI